MADYITDIKNKDNKISILQNLVEKNDGHVTRLKSMIEQLKKQLKFEQEKNNEMAKDMNKLRETIQQQNLKIRELQESLFKSKESERQLQIKIKDLQSNSPLKNTKGSSTTTAAQSKNSDKQHNEQIYNIKSMIDLTKLEESELKHQEYERNYQESILQNKSTNDQSNSPLQRSVERSQIAQNDEISWQNSEKRRRNNNLKVDSSVLKNSSFLESPKIQRTMLSVVEEDLSNIMKSAQYQKELDPALLKTIAKSIVAIKYTSKVMESSTCSIPCVSEQGDECNEMHIDKNYNADRILTNEDKNSLFHIKLNEVEQDELNSIEVRKKKSSSMSDKASRRISFQPKGIHYHNHHGNLKSNNSQLTPTSQKVSSNGIINTNQSDNQQQSTRQKGSSTPRIDTFDNQKQQESQTSLGSQNQTSQNGAGSLRNNQIQDEDIIEIKESMVSGVYSESTSGSNSPKCSEDADMYQPFSHFFVLGCDKDDVKEFDKMGVDRVLLPGKLLYNYSDRVSKSKNDPFEIVKKQVSEYAFPYGLEVKKIDGDMGQIKQIIIPPTKHGMNDKFFFFKMRSQENFKQVQVEKQKNDLLKIVNPNKVLFFTCLQIRDFIEITSDDDTQKKSYWRVQKIFCFVSYFPFYDLLSRLLQIVQDSIKVERQFVMLNADNFTELDKIDSDSVQLHISKNIEQYLQQWQRTELRILGKEYKFSMDQQGFFQYNLPSHPDFRKKSLSWSLIGPISCLSFQNFLFILFAILQEQHIIFVSTNLCLLTKAIACFEALIMPFQWPYPIVYTLPENLMGLLGSPQPIILGINRSGRYVLSQDLVESNPDHIFVLLDEGTILTNNNNYVKQYQKNPPSLSLKQQLAEDYSRVGLSLNDALKVYNQAQYQQFNSSEQYKRSFPIPKFHVKNDEIVVLENIMQTCFNIFQQKIISLLPKQPIYDSDEQLLDYDKIKSIILQQSSEEDKLFLNNFCSQSSQIFLYFCEDFYNLVEDNNMKEH
ncbi:DENN (AEX-3) domain protein (macronuclear) [Tetrahymena thermophila SB210]|uniref:DENN (AEX-3) domain protein n=1 Tax=Tetrahymena thermophila (strain SB210) TaxID=312017 RepID=Q245U2_TETTS|nr:DENN (AEX-3) domain protein [Tetrahymena thermophila SB210]EAS03541.2 DENN (AEX-3) domain protein [Tetrahymena thermophila SB210]|eukprot:XP_001023786.2 DENN (AEX-3) domain protein [Tetrahymena thermophila SB210]